MSFEKQKEKQATKYLTLHLKTFVGISFKNFPNDDLNKALNLLIYGISAAKLYKSSKLFHQCHFYILEDDNDYLQWLSHVKPYSKSRLDLKLIKNITDSPNFDTKLSKKFKNHKNKLLFILYENSQVLILKFKEDTIKNLFWQAIQYVSKRAVESKAGFGDYRRLLAQKLFIKADIDGSKTLDLEEIKKILQKLHIEINQDFLLNFFSKYDRDNSHEIDWTEFQAMVDDISLKPELKPLFRKYCKEANGLKEDDDFCSVKMYYQEFKDFLKIEQKQSLSELEFRKITNLFHSDISHNFLNNEGGGVEEEEKIIDGKSQLNYLFFSEFCSFIFSRNNEILDSEKLEIYQDMNRPLTDYYINSSHNTYLLANQLTGESNTKAYINAFSKGCRCVELDCWDGDKQEPIIYHGHTFTSKILFRDVVQTIKDYAFVFNPFPVILSLEDHCKKSQQDKIAEILIDILGDSLFFLPENYLDYGEFPSPESLKYKIIVKDKARLPSSKTKSLMESSAYEFERFESRISADIDDLPYLESKELNFTYGKISQEWSFNQKRFIVNKSQHRTLSLPITAVIQNNCLLMLLKTNELIPPLNNYKTHSLASPGSLSDKNQMMESSIETSVDAQGNSKGDKSQNLKKILTLFAIKMSLTIPRSIWNISSIKENVFDKYSKDNEDKFQDFQRKYFLRVYPIFTRVDSSNFDPVPMFASGCQMIALNFQTPDLQLLLYMSRFQENGGVNCGYILKPEFLRKENPRYLKEFTNICKIVCITVISGQQLRPENEEDVRDVVDPYVEVSFKGIHHDEKENAKIYKSRVVDNNGFNPKFGLQCQFKLCCPEMAFLVFKVFDQEVAMKDMRIGWNAVPFSIMRSGFRMVPLLNSNLNQIDFSYLFCKFEVKDVVLE